MYMGFQDIIRNIMKYRKIEKMETELRQSEERYRNLVELSPEPVAVHCEGKLVYINSAGVKLLGAVNQEQLIGKPILNFIHPQYHEIVIGRMRQVLEEGKPSELLEEKFIRLDGRIVDVEARAVPTTHLGKPAIQFICRDITERKQAKETLLESENRLRTLINAMPDMVIFKDGEGRWLEANDFTLQLLQLGDVPYQGKKDSELARLIDSYYEPLLGCEVSDEETWRTGAITHFEERIFLSDGAVKYFDAIKVPVFNQDGGRKGLVVIGRDVTERKLAERQLEKEKQQYKSLFENSPEAVLSFDLNGKVLGLNPITEKITGYPAEELLHQQFMSFIAPEDLDRILDCFSKSLQGQPQSLEGTMIHKKGHPVHLSGVSVPIIVDNQIVGLYGIAKDITELKLAEEAYRRLSRLHELILNSVGDGIFGIDLRDNVIFFNPAAARMTGFSKEDLSGRSIEEILFHVKPESIGIKAKCKFYQSLEDGVSHHVTDEVFWRKDGTNFPVEYMSTPIFENGKIVGAVISFKDITERKSTEELLRISEKLSVSGQLAAGIAHEIRNPLTSIKGFLQLLQSKSEENRKYCNIMLSELDRINAIVNEFLLLAKPQMQNLQMKEMGLLLQNVITLIDSQAIMQNIQIELETEAEIPIVKCDENQIKQVFINILKNAIEAMPHGGKVSIQVKILELDKILIRFRDEGFGIPEEKIPKLGEPFYTTKEKGNGLGLMVSYNIIEAHQGSISIKSQLHIGTTVDIILPVSR